MFTRIRITLLNGNSIVIDKDYWDDYSYDGRFIIIKKEGAWVAMYNAKEIFSVVLEKENEDDWRV